MPELDLVIFDCDGVLVDSERLIVQVEAQICQERGWNISADDIIREAAGLSTCVASSGSHEKMALTLGRTGLLDRFEGRIHSSTDPAVRAGKPAPDLFLHAAAQMGVDPARCAVIEDSPFGIEAALAAGMAPFGFAGSVIPAERLARHGVVVFESMPELPALLIDRR